MTAQRWSRFSVAQQLLMIANEMNRASKLLTGEENAGRLRNSYERVLALTDLTTELNANRSLRRELLRWRGLVGQLYLEEGSNASLHGITFRALLQLHPETWRQMPYVTGAAGPPRIPPPRDPP